jgi:hypothetical protein
MIKDRGFDAIINDLLIDNVLTMGSVLVAYITAFLCYLYLQFTNPGYNSSGSFTAPILAFGFLIGLQMVTQTRGRADGSVISRLFQLRVELLLYSWRWRKIHKLCTRTFQIYIVLLFRRILRLRSQCLTAKCNTKVEEKGGLTYNMEYEGS